MNSIKQHWMLAGIGAALAVATSLLFWFGPLQHPSEQHAMMLGAIGAVYFGFGLMDGRGQVMILETTVAVAILLLAALGISVSPIFVIVGLVLHGLWDVLHHPKAVTTKVPLWYPPFCAVYDWVLAILLSLLLIAYS